MFTFTEVGPEGVSELQLPLTLGHYVQNVQTLCSQLLIAPTESQSHLPQFFLRSVKKGMFKEFFIDQPI